MVSRNVARCLEMSETVKWQGGTLDVQARLVPRYLWNTASIDVFLDGRPILRTGGQLKLTGSQTATFTYADTAHTAELSLGSSGLAFCFRTNYELMEYSSRLREFTFEIGRSRWSLWL
jgi:hypothetical protein